MPLHVLPWVSWHNEMLAFAGVLLLAAFSLFQFWDRRATSRIPLPGATLLLMALAVTAVLQAVGGLILFWGDALVLVFYLALCIAALQLGFAAAGDPALVESRARALAVTLLLGALASTVVALVQTLNVWDGVEWIARMPYQRRPGGNLAQPNQLATLVLMGLASLVFLHEARRLSGGLFGLTALVLLAGIAVSESRTGLLGFGLLAGWWLYGRHRSGLRCLRPWTWVLLALVLLFLFVGWPSWFNTIDGITPTPTPTPAASNRTAMRFVVWSQLMEAIGQRPWFGWGLREVSQAHNAVAHAYSLSEPYSYSHNIVIDLAVGLGLPLALLVVILVGTWLWRRGGAAQTPLQWYCLGVALPVAVHSMSEFPFAYAYFLAPVMILLGINERLSSARVWLQIDRKMAGALLLAFGILASWSVVEYVELEEDFRIARFEALRVGQTPQTYQPPEIHLLTQLDGLVRGARIMPHPGMTKDELDLLRKVALRYPWPAIQNRYALSLVLNQQQEEGLRQLKVIRAQYGEKVSDAIKSSWETLAEEKYPQLRGLQLP